MQVILLERVERLGQMGDEVRVKDGFARNFLLPQKKALRATKPIANISRPRKRIWKRAIWSARPKPKPWPRSWKGKSSP